MSHFDDSVLTKVNCYQLLLILIDLEKKIVYYKLQVLIMYIIR